MYASRSYPAVPCKVAYPLDGRRLSIRCEVYCYPGPTSRQLYANKIVLNVMRALQGTDTYTPIEAKKGVWNPLVLLVTSLASIGYSRSEQPGQVE